MVGGDVVVTYGFNVPCRRFLLTAHVTRDRRMPIADEFILRLLKLTDKLEASRLGAFFGFTPIETATVLQDLQRKKHVVLAGDKVQLTAAAHEKFRTGQDGMPHILELETWVDRVWFDLISRNITPNDRTRRFYPRHSLGRLSNRTLSSTSAGSAGTTTPTRFRFMLCQT